MYSLAHPLKLFLFASLSLSDLGFTWLLLERGNCRAYEGNPIASWWLARFGWLGLAGFKLSIILLVAILIQVVSRRRPVVAGWVLEFGCFSLLAVVLYSGCLMGSVVAESRQTEQEVNLAHQLELRRVLEARGVEMLHLLETKKRVAQEVIDGRLALPTAAAHYRDLIHSRFNFYLQLLRQKWPGLTDEERYCREVISQVQLLLYGQPEQARVLTARLEAELSELLRYGTPRLPG